MFRFAFSAPLAQLDRALVYGTKGWGFELLMVHQKRRDETSRLFLLLFRYVSSFFLLFRSIRGVRMRATPSGGKNCLWQFFSDDRRRLQSGRTSSFFRLCKRQERTPHGAPIIIHVHSTWYFSFGHSPCLPA